MTKLHYNISLAFFVCMLFTQSNAVFSVEDSHDHHAKEEHEKGSHGGRLLQDDDFILELAIFETGVPPEFRAWVTNKAQPVNPTEVFKD